MKITKLITKPTSGKSNNIIPGNGEELKTPDKFDYYHYLRVIRRPTSIQEVITGQNLSIQLRNGKLLTCSPKIEQSEEDGEFSLTLEFENGSLEEPIQLWPDLPATHEVEGKDIKFTYIKEEKTKENNEKIYKNYIQIVEMSELTETIYKIEDGNELKIKICDRHRRFKDDQFVHLDEVVGDAEIKKPKKDGEEYYLYFKEQYYKCDDKKPLPKNKNVWLIYTNIKVYK